MLTVIAQALQVTDYVMCTSKFTMNKKDAMVV